MKNFIFGLILTVLFMNSFAVKAAVLSGPDIQCSEEDIKRGRLNCPPYVQNPISLATNYKKPVQVRGNHTLGLVSAVPTQSGQKTSLGLEARGIANISNPSVVRSLNYASRFMANEKVKTGMIQLAVQPIFIPKNLLVQARTQLLHTEKGLNIQYDIGPSLNLFQGKVGNVGLFANLSERIHTEKPLLEHDIIVRAQIKNTALLARGTLLTPINSDKPNTGRVYMELTQDFSSNRFQAVLGASTGGKIGEMNQWKDGLQVVSGLRTNI